MKCVVFNNVIEIIFSSDDSILKNIIYIIAGCQSNSKPDIKFHIIKETVQNLHENSRKILEIKNVKRYYVQPANEYSFGGNIEDENDLYLYYNYYYE